MYLQLQVRFTVICEKMRLFLMAQVILKLPTDLSNTQFSGNVDFWFYEGPGIRIPSPSKNRKKCHSATKIEKTVILRSVVCDEESPEMIQIYENAMIQLASFFGRPFALLRVTGFYFDCPGDSEGVQELPGYQNDLFLPYFVLFPRLVATDQPHIWAY